MSEVVPIFTHSLEIEEIGIFFEMSGSEEKRFRLKEAKWAVNAMTNKDGIYHNSSVQVDVLTNEFMLKIFKYLRQRLMGNVS